MYYTTVMSATFESEKNRKAFIYTACIATALLLIAFYWTWVIPPPPAPVTQDLIEINLGNYDEGFGTVQPLIKGEKSPGEDPVQETKVTPAPAPVNNTPTDEVQPDDNKEEDAAPVVKPDKPTPKPPTNLPKQPTAQPVKNTNTPPVIAPEPKPRVPKIAGYGGPKGGTGNGATEDNGYKYQGNKPGGKGDAGDPNGKPDSYGNNPGGKVGGPRVTSGDRKIIRYYSFTADLDKATIYAIVKVSPNGQGTFIGIGKNSTSTNRAYADEIAQRLPNIQFDKSDHESTVTVQFNFTVK
jgi:hypothetical protein